MRAIKKDSCGCPLCPLCPFVSVPFRAACGFGVAFGLHIGSGGGGGVVCGLPLRLEEQLVEKGYPSNQAPSENT